MLHDGEDGAVASAAFVPLSSVVSFFDVLAVSSVPDFFTPESFAVGFLPASILPASSEPESSLPLSSVPVESVPRAETIFPMCDSVGAAQAMRTSDPTTQAEVKSAILVFTRP